MRVNNLFIVIARAMEAQNASRTIGGKGRKEKEEKMAGEARSSAGIFFRERISNARKYQRVLTGI